MAKQDTPTISPEEKAQARAAKASGNGKGSAKPAAKKSGAKPGSTRSKYPAHVAERSKLVKLVEGYKNPASPKQQKFMDDAFKKALKKAGGESEENLLVIAGLYGASVELAEGETPPTREQAFARLEAFARSDREASGSTKTMKTLTDAVADEAAIRPRHVAAALIAYTWQLDGTAADRLAAAAPAKPEAPEAAPEESAPEESEAPAEAEAPAA